MKLGAIPIRIWDEARLANNALHIYQHGFSLVTYFEGTPDLWNTKPPLMIWLQALCCHLLGPTETAIRLPSALASIITGLSLYQFTAKHLRSPQAGMLSGLVFASTYAYIYIHGGRTGDYDALLCLFVLLYCLHLYQYLQNGQLRHYYIFWIFLTLAALTKGVAALLFAPGLLLYIVVTKRLKTLVLNPWTYVGAGGFMLLVGGYYALRESLDPGYWQAVWQNELGGRYLATLEEHLHPFSHYWQNLWNWRYPFWCYAIVPSFGANFFFTSDRKVKHFTTYSFALTLSYLLIISAAKTKLEWYDLPLYPFFALQIGCSLYSGYHALRQRLPLSSAIAKKTFGVLFILIVFAVPFYSSYRYIFHFREQPWDIEPHKQGYYLQEIIRTGERLDKTVFCYSNYHAQIQFYILRLRAEGVTVRLQKDLSDIGREETIVVSEPDMIAAAELKGWKRIGARHGCIIYKQR